ncbi:MAG: DUF2400 family protein [Candidatus Bathyarchaeia archaeon]
MTIEELIRIFVRNNSNVVDIQFDGKISPKLPINPRSKDFKEMKKTAHYLLLAASINEYKVVGRAENVRRILTHLHNALGDELFKKCEAEDFRDHIRKCKFYEGLGEEKDRIPGILASVNRFVKYQAKGNILNYAQKFTKPKYLVENISENIEAMRDRLKDKLWIYMRWMVRPSPDLRIFYHFRPKDLLVPLTLGTATVGTCLGLVDKVDISLWINKEKATQARQNVTEFARKVFSEDPAIVDYPFFLLGRWLAGEELNIKTLEDSLLLFNDLYNKTGWTCSFCDAMSRYESGWEKKITKLLYKLGIPFRIKPITFSLPNNITYKPDFILIEPKIFGKNIVLEPHCFHNFDREINKFKTFRQLHQSEYFLILATCLWMKSYLPKEAYDVFWPIEYIHVHLLELKHRM